jgi:hypothetical protein
MIKTTNFVPVLFQMQNSEHVFHLTGSRYFGAHTDKSDWDFFTEASDKVVEWLKILDFYSVFEPYSGDPFECLVMKNDKENIHVQLVHDVDHKNRAQLFLRNSMHKFPKQYHEELWYLAFLATKK